MQQDDTPTGQNWTPENPYAEEAKARWGNTDAWKQSQERVQKMGKEGFAKVGAEADEITKAIAKLKLEGKAASDASVQELIAKHYNWLRNFYEPSLEMYRGLGSMYVDDPRFAANYEKYGEGMAVFMRDAMHTFADKK